MAAQLIAGILTRIPCHAGGSAVRVLDRLALCWCLLKAPIVCVILVKTSQLSKLGRKSHPFRDWKSVSAMVDAFGPHGPAPRMHYRPKDN